MRRLSQYIYDREGWPHLQWDQAPLAGLLAEVRHRQGRLLGQMEGLGFQLREEATLRILTQDVVKTSEIEGEKLDEVQVRSSIARRMDIDIGAFPAVDRNVEGIVEVMLDATRRHAEPLTQERLFGWHTALFPNGENGIHKIAVGRWRTDERGPMQVVSGTYRREKIHFEAPAHTRLNQEMAHFLRFFNAPPEVDLVLRSAVAHFWFVTIHPFDDGNGRIARAIADSQLARSERSPQRFYSMSAQIEKERKAYYEILEASQKGTLNLNPWIEWYLQCLKRAIGASQETLEAVLKKAAFWKTHAGHSFNDRQRALINGLLDGWEGKLTSSKWAKLAKCSQDTAWRDITDLVSRQMLVKEEAGGRSTSYQLRALRMTGT